MGPQNLFHQKVDSLTVQFVESPPLVVGKQWRAVALACGRRLFARRASPSGHAANKGLRPTLSGIFELGAASIPSCVTRAVSRGRAANSSGLASPPPSA